MFEVGFTEIILIFGIALLVLGPARLPKLAADLGRWAGRARAMARQLRTQLEQEVQQIDPLASTGTGTRPDYPATPAADTARAEPAQAASGVLPALPAVAATGDTTPAAPALTPSGANTTIPDEPKPAG
jgi:sec-independent protein translocase protein TatB